MFYFSSHTTSSFSYIHVSRVYPSIAKLASLLIKTLAKPMSKKIKVECSNYIITQNALVNIGQTTNAVTARMKIWSEGYAVRSIKPLEREAAVTQGAEFVGEAFIFLVAGGIVLWEYNKKAEEDTAKKNKATEERRCLDERICALEKSLETIIERSAKDSLRNPAEPPQDSGHAERRWWPL